MNPRSPVIRHAFVSFAFLVSFLLLARPEVVVISRLGYVAWYPPIGLAIAMLLGLSPWYAFLFGFANALAGFLNYSQPITFYGETFGAVGVALCYGVAAHVLRGPLKIDTELRRRGDVLKYVFVNISGAAAATIIGVLCLVGDRSISWNEFYVSAEHWFLGDTIAILGIAPFLLIHVLPRVRKQFLLESSNPEAPVGEPGEPRFELSQVLETLAQAASLVAVVWLMFAQTSGNLSFFYIGFIPIIWIAMRRGVRGAVIGVLALNSSIAIAMRFFPPTVSLFGKTGLFMMVVSATGLLVGSGLTERDCMARDLNEQTSYLKALIQSSPFGIVVLDRRGRVEVVNPAFQKLLLHAGRDTDCKETTCSLMCASCPLANSSEMIRGVLENQRSQKTVRQQCSDGTFLDLAVQAVPLTIENQVRGAYMMYQDISEQVRASEVERSQSESLRNLVTELQHRDHERALLNEMRDLFGCCSTPAEAAKVVAESVQKLFPHSRSGSFYVFQTSVDLAEATLQWGIANVSEQFLKFDSCWCLRRGQPHWSQPSGSGIKCAHLMSGSTGTSLCVPILGQGHALGVLHLEFAPAMELAGHSGPAENLRAALQLLASSVAGQTAMALSSLNSRQRLQQQSIRDPLTDLFNRRFMDESLETEVLRATRNSRPLSLILIDIDHFKRFNDTFGHDAGDHVLQSLADLLRKFFRASDVCCRHGGEEFAIILPDSSLQNAVVRATSLRTEVKRLNLIYDKQNLGSVTVSIGVAAFPEHGSSAGALLKIADRCLYESKASGRDVVTVADQCAFSSPQPYRLLDKQ